MNKTISNRISKIVDSITEKYHPEKIILFGSYASGAPDVNSDIDLFIVIDTDKPSWDLSVEISSTVPHIFPLDIIVKTPGEIQKRLKCGDFFIKNIMESGKVLYERTC